MKVPGGALVLRRPNINTPLLTTQEWGEDRRGASNQDQRGAALPLHPFVFHQSVLMNAKAPMNRRTPDASRISGYRDGRVSAWSAVALAPLFLNAKNKEPRRFSGRPGFYLAFLVSSLSQGAAAAAPHQMKWMKNYPELAIWHHFAPIEQKMLNPVSKLHAQRAGRP